MHCWRVSNVSKQFRRPGGRQQCGFPCEPGRDRQHHRAQRSGKNHDLQPSHRRLRCHEGKIVFDGKEIQNKKVQHIVNAGIARTFQNIRLFKNMRTIENVMVGFHQNTRYNIFDLIFRTPRFRKYEKEAHIKALEGSALPRCLKNTSTPTLGPSLRRAEEA